LAIDAYTYDPFPVIDGIQPRYGGPLAGGTEMIITGSNFMEGVTVSIGENLADGKMRAFRNLLEVYK
jgi:hypothetical protein